MYSLRQWWMFAKQINHQYNVSILRMLLENIVLYCFRGVGPRYYFEAQIWQPQLSWQDKLSYSDSRGYKTLLAELNPPAYRKISQHKVVEKAVMQLNGIRVAPFIGFFHPSRGVEHNGQMLNNRQTLHELLSAHIGQRIVIKLVEGWGGHGMSVIIPLEVNHQLQIKDVKHDTVSAFDAWFSRLTVPQDGLILEAYVEQHCQMARLNPDSVNTLRVWVKLVNNIPQIVGTIVRIGRAGSLVDNASQGGFIARVVQDTGIIDQAMSCDIVPVVYQTHPDSGIKLSGTQIPFWHESMSLAKRALLAFPEMKFTGLDIAITADGPLVIELNLEPDKVTARNFGKSLKQLLGVNA